MNNNPEPIYDKLFAGMNPEQRKELAEKYPWFDAARRAVTPKNKYPVHILLQKSVHPAMASTLPPQVSAAGPKGEPAMAVQHDDTVSKGSKTATLPQSGKEAAAIETEKQSPVPADDCKEIRRKREPGKKTKEDLVREKRENPPLPDTETDQHAATIDIIDTFIEKGEYKIVPNEATPEKLPAAGDPMLPVDDELITEELAEIYMDQELFAQAIAIYDRLSLLYPKKSVYFAEIIEKAKALAEADEGQ